MNGRVVIFAGQRHGYEPGHGEVGAFMYDSCSGWAFGPLFDSADDCKEFLDWSGAAGGETRDLRQVPTKELYALHVRWLAETGRTT